MVTFFIYVETLEIYSFIKFQAYSIFLLTIVTMLYTLGLQNLPIL